MMMSIKKNKVIVRRLRYVGLEGIRALVPDAHLGLRHPLYIVECYCLSSSSGAVTGRNDSLITDYRH